MNNPSEQEIQKTILEYLRIKKFVCFKHHSTGSGVRDGKTFFFAHSEKGVADIIACSPKGSFVAIEVKRPGGKVSPEQQDFLDRVKAIGGIAFVAYSVQDVLDVFES